MGVSRGGAPHRRDTGISGRVYGRGQVLTTLGMLVLRWHTGMFCGGMSTEGVSIGACSDGRVQRRVCL